MTLNRFGKAGARTRKPSATSASYLLATGNFGDKTHQQELSESRWTVPPCSLFSSSWRSVLSWLCLAAASNESVLVAQEEAPAGAGTGVTNAPKSWGRFE